MGNGISIFPIMMLGMLFWKPIQTLWDFKTGVLLALLFAFSNLDSPLRSEFIMLFSISCSVSPDRWMGSAERR